MITLPNGCYCSELSVFPKNWKSDKAPLKKQWRITYRFYDPLYKAQYPKGKQRTIKVSKSCNTLEEKQASIRLLISYELNQLKNMGFNLITGKYVTPVLESHDVNPETLFLDALKIAYENKSAVSCTKKDLRSVMKYVEKAVILLGYDFMMIKDVRRKHIKLILDKCGKIKARWSPNTFNMYRSYLSVLFSELVEMEAIETNPVRDIRKQKTTRMIKKILTAEECNHIDQFTRQLDPNLHRFIHIFFHSGSRITEILKVQGEHIDLVNQKVKYLVLKGKKYEWVERTIKDVVLPFWERAMQGCGSKDYVFSRGLTPGPKSIRSEQITRRWRRHIKVKLGIECDFYSLKHLNTDQTSALLDIKAAAAQNSHKSTVITMNHYAINEKERMHQKLKNINNKFAG